VNPDEVTPSTVKALDAEIADIQGRLQDHLFKVDDGPGIKLAMEMVEKQTEFYKTITVLLYKIEQRIQKRYREKAG
jgi:hypothetical protein